MRIGDTYEPGKLSLSFELFPPKTPAGDVALFRNLDELMAFSPSYVTCTYGAGGSTREKTLGIISEVHRRYGVPVASHLTCVGSTVEQLRSYLREAWDQGVTNIVALRGDPPQGQDLFKAIDGGFRYASELVAMTRGEFPQFGIAVAGYPETHQEATSAEADLENLRRKVDGGGDVVITQLFYDNADYFAFCRRARAAGIQAPIVPGILPVTNYAQVQRITSLCKARLPEKLVGALTAAGEDEEGQFEAGTDYASEQVRELIDAGVPGVHFYVLNRSPATVRILQSLEATGRRRTADRPSM